MENVEMMKEEILEEEAVQAEEAEATESADEDSQTARLTAELETLKKEKEELNDRLLRTRAEYDNFRKRSVKEKGESYSNGVTKAVSELIPVIDTLEMALAAPCSDENFRKGIEMTLTKAQTALANLGVTEIEALGKPFDPNVHARVMQEPAEDGAETGIVTKLFQKGYKIGDKIIRPATVVVSC